MTIALFIAVLFVLILVHELGHFVVAKWARMRVDEFAIGFPPRLVSFKKAETEYSINLLPIGGYVKILGENGEDEISSADRSRSFSARPRHLQALVLLAGVTMNILTAWLIFFAVALIGQPTLVEETEAKNAELTILAVSPNSPAATAGIPVGAEVTRVTADDMALGRLTPSEFTSFVSRNQSVEFTYRYKNEEKTIELTPQSGVIKDEPDRKVIGISTGLVETVKESPFEAISSASVRTVEALRAITVGVFSLIASAFSFSADLSQVTGPIGIAGAVGEAASFGIVPLLVFTAFISLNLAVINVLPIPALDGGRLLFVLIESVTRRSIDPVWMSRVNLIGFALLITLMIAVTYNDIVRLV